VTTMTSGSNAGVLRRFIRQHKRSEHLLSLVLVKYDVV